VRPFLSVVVTTLLSTTNGNVTSFLVDATFGARLAGLAGTFLAATGALVGAALRATGRAAGRLAGAALALTGAGRAAGAFGATRAGVRALPFCAWDSGVLGVERTGVNIITARETQCIVDSLLYRGGLVDIETWDK
jgi:hypothetical protein